MDICWQLQKNTSVDPKKEMEEMKSDLMFHCKSLHHRGNFESADIYGDFLGTRWRQLSVHRADLQTVNVELYQ